MSGCQVAGFSGTVVVYVVGSRRTAALSVGGGGGGEGDSNWVAVEGLQWLLVSVVGFRGDIYRWITGGWFVRSRG